MDIEPEEKNEKCDGEDREVHVPSHGSQHCCVNDSVRTSSPDPAP